MPGVVCEFYITLYPLTVSLSCTKSLSFIVWIICLACLIVSLQIPIIRSGDATARIWSIGDAACGPSIQNGPSGVIVLKHFKGRTNEKSKDVTTLDWNVR